MHLNSEREDKGKAPNIAAKIQALDYPKRNLSSFTRDANSSTCASLPSGRNNFG